MLSLETEKALRSAGFKVIAPGLIDILDGIEARGYQWALICVQKGQYQIKLYQNEGLWAVYTASTPDEAAAQTLIWVLQKGAEA